MRRIALYLIALAAILAGVRWLASEPPVQVRVLPDGSTLTLAHTYCGRNPRFLPGNRLQRILASIVSRSEGWRRDRDMLVFWIKGNGFPDPHHWRLRFVPIDEHGCEADAMDLARHSTDIPGWFSSQPDYRGYDVYPRHGQRVGLRVYGTHPAWSPRWARVAEFYVPNPKPGPYPVWTPEPFPITRRVGNLAFTLTRLVAGCRKCAPLVTAPEGEPSWSIAAFSVTEHGRTTTDWLPDNVVISDATGNAWRPFDQNWLLLDQSIHNWVSCPAGKVHLHIPCSLWPHESAWKLGVEFARTRRAHFSPDELWRAGPIPVTDRGSASPAVATTTRQGVRLDLRVTRRRHDDCIAVVQVYFPNQEIPADARLTFVRVRDDRGREVRPYTGPGCGMGPSTFPGVFEHEFGLRLQRGVRAITVDLALHRSRFVEFLAAAQRP